MNRQTTLNTKVQLAIALVLSIAACAPSADYFVSPQGADTNPGTLQKPFSTLAKVASVLKPGDTCYLRDGVYRETLRPARSGRPNAVITFTNYRNEKPLISGADAITGFMPEKDGIYAAPMPWTLGDDNQIFADGRMLSEACWPAPGDKPLFDPVRAVATDGSTTTLICDKIPGGDDAWKDARLWCAGGSAWICWTSNVTGYDADTHILTFAQARDRWYTPRKGNLFALRGIRRALHAPDQWFYEPARKQLLVIPPRNTDIRKLAIEAKRRTDAIDLSGKSHIRINGINIHAAGIRTNEQSSHITLGKCTARFVSHSNLHDTSSRSGILILGRHILLLSCDFGYSASSVVTVKGSDNRVINCHIHHGGYLGLWRGTVALSGRRNVFSHNTVRHAGRDLVNTHGLMESLIQYNDVSDAGHLTKDLGMFYGHNTDFANTEFRYNLVHDNHAEHCAMGIYFDHLSHNAIVHHNVVWNVGMDAIRINNPSYCSLVYNNTCADTGRIGTFDHSKRNDLFACRYTDNLFNQRITLPDHVALANNQVIASPAFINPADLDYRLKNADHKDLGAHAPDQKLWRAGCDLDNPPIPLPTYKAPRIAWMNTIRNACFEFGTFEGWTRTHAKSATLTKGNGWGNSTHGDNRTHATGTSKYELQLGPKRDGVTQTVKDLSPNRTYTLSVWLRVSDDKQTVTMSVKQKGTDELKASSSSTEWTRKSIEFTTAPGVTEVTISLLKSTDTNGHAYCDNLTLPLVP